MAGEVSFRWGYPALALYDKIRLPPAVAPDFATFPVSRGVTSSSYSEFALQRPACSAA